MLGFFVKKMDDQRIWDLHSEVMTYIKGSLDPERFDELKEVVKNRNKITRLNSAKCDTFEKLWEMLSLNKCIEHGNYQFLKDVLKQIGMPSVNDEIQRIEVKMRKKKKKNPFKLYFRKNRSDRALDDSGNCAEKNSFKKSDDQSAAALFKGCGVDTDEHWAPKKPETGERMRNGWMGRPAGGSDVTVKRYYSVYRPYELEEQPQSSGNPYDLEEQPPCNPYELEQPAKGGVTPWTVERLATADNANDQYAVVNKVKRGQKGPAFVTPNETPNPRAEPRPYVYAINLKQDIDYGNINDDSVQPADEYAEVRKPLTFVPGLSSAYADIELGAGGAPSIQELSEPVSKSKTKIGKRKEENKKGEEGNKKKGKKRDKEGDNKENKNEDKKKDKKKGKKGDKKYRKKQFGSSDDISGQRPEGDSSCADPMSGDFATYAEVGQATCVGRIEPVDGSQPDEFENVYDVCVRKGPNYRPGASDPTYGVLS